MTHWNALTGIVLLSSVLAFGLAACSSADAEPQSSEEVEEQLVMTMVHTGERLPTREWQPQSGRPAPGPCGEKGKALFSWSLIAEPDESHLIDAETVRDYWKSLGMDVRLVKDPVPTVYARGGGFRSMSFSTAPGLYHLSGTSLCFAGDSAELEDRPKASPGLRFARQSDADNQDLLLVGRVPLHDAGQVANAESGGRTAKVLPKLNNGRDL